jgi:polysaccharide deacetylase family protein (PEP-CTERM system associated)
MTPISNALTIDVEDWYHDADGLGGSATPGLEPRVERNLHRLLDLLDRRNARATLFFLGDVVERSPGLVREAFARGHEIASHGYRHRPVGTWLRREFRDDVERSAALLQGVTGARVCGYRAPYFSLRADVHWPSDVLAEVGFTYDSSVLPIDRAPGLELVSPRAPYRLGSGIWEVPVAISRYLFWNLPLVGGFALRMLPLGFVEKRLAEFNREVGPAVVHFHPWEIDARGPEPRSISFVVRGLKRYGRNGLVTKLERLLGAHSFGPIADVFPEVGANASATERHDTPSA